MAVNFDDIDEGSQVRLPEGGSTRSVAQFEQV
jgi:hypothetical protein